MLTNLRNALPGLIKSALPDIFAGAAPAVTLEFPIRGWTPAPLPEDPIAGEPSPEEALDLFEIDPAHAEGPFTLSRHPLPGPRRATLLTPEGGRLPLPPGALDWISEAPPVFSVRLPHPPPPFEKGPLEIAYTVAAVSTRVLAVHELAVRLSAADPDALDRAETLLLTWSALNREAMRVAGGYSLVSGDYRAEVVIRGIRLRGGGGSAQDFRELLFDVEIETRAVRTGSESGQPIRAIESREVLR
jgi:hypothetical protein